MSPTTRWDVRHTTATSHRLSAVSIVIDNDFQMTTLTTLRTDAAGRVEVTGWLGDYVVECGGATAGFALEPTTAEATLELG